jgi:hypothetical protein
VPFFFLLFFLAVLPRHSPARRTLMGVSNAIAKKAEGAVRRGQPRSLQDLVLLATDNAGW